MLFSKKMSISYGQILVFLPNLPRPGLVKTDEHIAQGFAWAPGIVSFSMPDLDGACLVQVRDAEQTRPGPSSLWSIAVPFQVSAQPVQVDTVGLTYDVSLPLGTYRLVLDVLAAAPDQRDDLDLFVNLNLYKDSNPDFIILKKGDMLKTDKVIRKDAEYA